MKCASGQRIYACQGRAAIVSNQYTTSVVASAQSWVNQPSARTAIIPSMARTCTVLIVGHGSGGRDESRPPELRCGRAVYSVAVSITKRYRTSLETTRSQASLT